MFDQIWIKTEQLEQGTKEKVENLPFRNVFKVSQKDSDFYCQYLFLSISRKAVKAAIILLPLLGITNFVVMTDPPTHDVTTFGFWSYTTFFLVSFQGFFISLLYCFLNGEVCIHILFYNFVPKLQTKQTNKKQ